MAGGETEQIHPELPAIADRHAPQTLGGMRPLAARISKTMLNGDLQALLRDFERVKMDQQRPIGRNKFNDARDRSRRDRTIQRQDFGIDREIHGLPELHRYRAVADR